jgi:hypothetical protein
MFNVVMFSKNYATPWYWEMMARGFKKLLKKPFYISYYVYGPGDRLQDVPTAAELLTELFAVQELAWMVLVVVLFRV